MSAWMPRTLRQSGFKMICTSDVTINVESRPLPPCTNTGLPSWSMHWATTQAAFNEFSTSDIQFECSRRSNHLSVVLAMSLHAEREIRVFFLLLLKRCTQGQRKDAPTHRQSIWRNCPKYPKHLINFQSSVSFCAIDCNADQFRYSIFPYSMYRQCNPLYYGPISHSILLRRHDNVFPPFRWLVEHFAIKSPAKPNNLIRFNRLNAQSATVLIQVLTPFSWR